MSKRYRIVVIFTSTVVLMFLGYFVLRRVNSAIEGAIIEHKRTHVTSGTVVNKEHIRFDENKLSYVRPDGIAVKREPGDEEWRVYYEIDSFEPVDESTRTRLSTAEKTRLENSGPRFSIFTKRAYDDVTIGNKLQVRWRWLGDERIEIVSAHKPVTAEVPDESPSPD